MVFSVYLNIHDLLESNIYELTFFCYLNKDFSFLYQFCFEKIHQSTEEKKHVNLIFIIINYIHINFDLQEIIEHQVQIK